MAKIKFKHISSREEYFDDVRYILGTLWAIPSMVDKLPIHVYYRLEAVIEYKDKHGWGMDECKCGGVDDGQPG